MCTKYDALGLNDACPEAAKVVQTAWSKPLEKLNSFEVSRLNPTTRNVERRVQVPSAVALYCKPQQRSGPVLMRSRDQVGSSPITRQVSRRQQDGNVAYLGILLMELRTWAGTAIPLLAQGTSLTNPVPLHHLHIQGAPCHVVCVILGVIGGLLAFVSKDIRGFTQGLDLWSNEKGQASGHTCAQNNMDRLASKEDRHQKSKMIWRIWL